MAIIRRGLYSIINEKYIADIDDEDSSSMAADNSAFLGGDDTQRTQHTITVICITDQKCNIGKAFADIKAKMRETIDKFTENVGSTRYYCNFVGCNEKLKEKYEYKKKYVFESKNEYIGKVRDLQKIYPLPNNQFGIAVGIDCNLLFDTYEKVLEFIYSLSDTSFDTKGLFDKGFIVFEPYVGDNADETHNLDDTIKIPFNIQKLRYDYKMHYAISLLKFLGLDDNITIVAEKLYGNNGIDEWLRYGKFSDYKLSQPIILKVENEMNIQNGDIKSLSENIYAHWQILELPNAKGDVAYSPSKGQFGTQPLNSAVAQYL